MKRNTIAKAVILVALGVLQGCGGGGGGGGGVAFPITAVPASDSGPAPASTSGAEPTTSPAPSPAPVAPPVPPTEPAPSLDPTACINAPQPGSAAEVGNGFEGVWDQNVYGGAIGRMLIGAAGDVVGYRRAEASSVNVDNFNGTFSFSAANSSWQVASATINPYPTTNAVPFTGSGTFVAKSTMDGTYSVDGAAPKSFDAWAYRISNYLAVDSALLTGAWGGTQYGVTGLIEIAPDGSFTGSTRNASEIAFGACTLSGTVLPREPGTSRKNYLTVRLQAVDAAKAGEKSCSLVSVTEGVGYIAVNQGTMDGVCKRSMSLNFLLKDAAGNYSIGAGFPR